MSHVGLARPLHETLFEETHVDTYLADHDHSLQHIIVGNFHQFVSGASEATQVAYLPQIKFAASQYGFMVFSVTSSSLLVHTIDYKGNVIYAVEVKK